MSDRELNSLELVEAFERESGAFDGPNINVRPPYPGIVPTWPRLIRERSLAEAAPPPLDGLDVETIAQIRHEDQEIDGNHCWHRNQHLAGRDCGEWAIRFAAEYAALRDEGETT